ncbi:MAG TPA: redoxin domain-containing protein [Candidatus Nitrosotalea sp.]|nr:redoxin domain-containing protein [Candidatus Nitrosotalea sp.]
MNEGDIAPDFELPANNGSIVKLGSFKGQKNIVLCFYPKNHLFACPSKKIFQMAEATIKAYPKIVEQNADLFAISVDTVQDQKKFVDEYKIPYLHLSDTSKSTCKIYAGLNLAGLAKRSTFIINKDGKIAKIFRDVNVGTHGQEIIQTLQSLA